MPHAYIKAWPIVRGQVYERIPLADTLRSPDTTAADMRTALRPLGRWAFKLGWDFLAADQLADVLAAFEHCAGNWRAIPFLEWDTLEHDYLLSRSWSGSSFVAAPLPFYEVTSIAGYFGSVATGATTGPNTANPFVGITYVLNYWPDAGTVSVSAATLTSAGAVAGNPIWLRVVGRISYPKAKMDRASITVTAREDDATLAGVTGGLWRCSINLVEDELL